MQSFAVVNTYVFLVFYNEKPTALLPFSNVSKKEERKQTNEKA
jgi:hypothetical protein